MLFSGNILSNLLEPNLQIFSSDKSNPIRVPEKNLEKSLSRMLKIRKKKTDNKYTFLRYDPLVNENKFQQNF